MKEDMTYEDFRKAHARLSGNVDVWEQRLDAAKVEYDTAAANFDNKTGSYTPEEREDKLATSNAKLGDCLEGTIDAKKKLVALETDHPEFNEDRKDGKEPAKFLKEIKEKVETLVEGAIGVGAALQISGAVLNTEVSTMPSNATEVSKPYAPEHDDPEAPRPRGQRAETSEVFRRASVENKTVNDATDNARSRSGPDPPSTRPEVTSVEAQGSATFGAQAFRNEPEPSPHREAANDNNPRGPGSGGAGAAESPANDNDRQQASTKAVAKPVANEQIASDFKAPPPPPPPPTEKSNAMSR